MSLAMTFQGLSVEINAISNEDKEILFVICNTIEPGSNNAGMWASVSSTVNINATFAETGETMPIEGELKSA